MRNKKIFNPIVIVITIVIAISSITYRNISERGEEEFKELFYSNKNIFANLSTDLLMIEGDLEVTKRS